MTEQQNNAGQDERDRALATKRDRSSSVQMPTGTVSTTGEAGLAVAVRAVIDPPTPGERYHVRGLTDLWCHEVGKDSAHTRRSYTHALTQWLDYCLRARVHPLHARRADVDDWIAHLDSAHPDTVNARLAAVRSWYRYLISNDVDVRDPAAQVNRPKRKRAGSKTSFLDENGLNAVLSVAATRVAATTQVGGLAAERAARDLAVLRILATTAVRSGPVQLATVEDVRTEVAGHRVLRYHAKGAGTDDQRYKPLVPFTASAVDDYLRVRAERLDVAVTQLHGLAFVTTPHHGNSGEKMLSSGSLTAMIRSIATEADVANAGSLTPHSIRHTMGTLLTRVRPLSEVQAFFDHADPRTTSIYVHVDEALNASPAYTAVGFIRDDQHH